MNGNTDNNESSNIINTHTGHKTQTPIILLAYDIQIESCFAYVM